jgi:hypothetical protein
MPSGALSRMFLRTTLDHDFEQPGIRATVRRRFLLAIRQYLPLVLPVAVMGGKLQASGLIEYSVPTGDCGSRRE